MKKVISFILFISIFQLSFAQEYQGKIHGIKQNGFHLIEISPELRSVSQNNLNHIRILDSKKSQVPYVFFRENSNEHLFQNFPIISNEAIENELTNVVVSNDKQQKINELVLKIANTDGSKKVSISGSDDGKKWFGLINNQIIENLNDANDDFIERSFKLPLNNYKFIKFAFVDKKSLPLNILQAGIYLDTFKPKNVVSLKNVSQKILSDKRNKQTKIEISFKEPQSIDGIKFLIDSDDFYMRKATIYVEQKREEKRNEIVYNEEIISFYINSNKSNVFDIPNIFVKNISIVIDNSDNPELKFSTIELFQNEENLLANLKANEVYSILVDNSLQVPTYDLEFAEIDYSKVYPKISVFDLEKISNKTKVEETKNFWQTSTFMWICIVLAVFILGYFSLSMIKDLGKEK